MKRSEALVGDLGEKRLLREVIKPLLPDVPDGLGSGDDGAVIPFPEGRRLVISTDRLPEDLLALKFGAISPYELGRYLVAVSVSDIGAMGATPLGVLLSLGLPNDFPVNQVREVVRGAVDAGRKWSAPVVGGDTKWSSILSLSSTAFGHVGTRTVLSRHDARPGDIVAVSGPVGAFGAALAYFDALSRGRISPIDSNQHDELRRHLALPEPRIQLGSQLVAAEWCHGAMDITDGLGQSLAELTEASSVGVRIDADTVPVHPLAETVGEALSIDPFEIVFGIGLDLELLIALDKHGLAEAKSMAILPFGSFTREPGVQFERSDHIQQELPGRKWEHFDSPASDFIARD